MKADGEDDEQDDETKMDETKEAGVGHNQPPDPDGERGREAIRDYDASVAKEQANRDDAIAAAARYGAVLIAGRARCRSNNEFGDWIKAQGLASDGLFRIRQERQAAMQIAEIMAHVAKDYCQPLRGLPELAPDQPHDVVARETPEPVDDGACQDGRRARGKNSARPPRQQRDHERLGRLQHDVGVAGARPLCRADVYALERADP